MKRIVLLAVFLLPLVLCEGCGVLLPDDGKLGVCSYINGFWGNWKECLGARTMGSKDDFIIYRSNEHPSNYGTRIFVYNMDAKLKYGQWYEYQGMIEYSGDKDYTSKNYVESITVCDSNFGLGLITRPATIKVCQKGARICYNVYFDGVGAGYSVYSYSLK